MIKHGFIIGRFQPFHNGHKQLIAEASAHCEVVHVFIGSANKLQTFVNPLPTKVRLEVLRRELAEFDNVRIHTVNDEATDEQWIMAMNSAMNHLTDYGDPSEWSIFTGTKDQQYYEDKFVVPVITLEGDLDATGIRSAFYKGLDENVKKSVPSHSLDSLMELRKSASFGTLVEEYLECTQRKAEAQLAHKFNNPIEPVCHAAVVQDGKILLVQRNSVRGFGQWAIPGGFLENTESTIDCALRELREETGINLEGRKAIMLSQSVEENLDDLSVRTLGINYLFAAHPEEELTIDFDPNECLDCQWFDVTEVLNGNMMLFYNHNTVAQRLFAAVAVQEGDPDEPSGEG